jgi:hypothetical protein
MRPLGINSDEGMFSEDNVTAAVVTPQDSGMKIFLIFFIVGHSSIS